MKKTMLLQERPAAEVYFAAANCAEGFRSYFPTIFAGAKRLYILKGGPGTGKSRFMEDTAGAAEERGLSVIRFRCSSDPDSLDGVLIPAAGIGVLDGTAPHVADPKYPGAAEEILNLGGFWDSEQLRSRRAAIQESIDRKEELYRRALQLLQVAGILRKEENTLLEKLCDRDKMRRAAGRILAQLPTKHGSEAAAPSLRMVEAIGMKGRVRFRSLENLAKTIYRIPPFFGGEGQFLQILREMADEKGIPYAYSLSPLTYGQPNALYFSEGRLLVIADGEAGEQDHLLNLRRFYPPEALREQRSLLRYYEQEQNGALRGAEEILRRVKALHFSIEQIYTTTMDFDAKEKFTREFLGYLF